MGRDLCYCNNLIITPPPSSSCNGDCIVAPHMLLATNGTVNSVGPCGESKTVLWDDCLNDCGCGNLSLQFETESHTDNIVVNSINSNGITFTSAGEESDDYIAEITFIIRCGRLSARGSLTVVYDDLCYNVAACSEGYECDKCSGECVAIGPDLSLS